MNMIVNASDLVGYEAENKKSKESARKEVLAKLVAAWEGKNSRSAKKFGTLGLLAVSLAACNSDDDDGASADLAAQLAAAQAAQAAAETAQAAADPESRVASFGRHQRDDRPVDLLPRALGAAGTQRHAARVRQVGGGRLAAAERSA